jgi:hypothetical protein
VEKYLEHLKKVWLGMGLLLTIETVVFAVTGRTALVPSILLGGCGSYVYSFMLAYRVRRASELDANTAVSYMRAGLGYRLMLVSLVGVIALKIPGISFIPVLLGLFTLQIIIHVYGFLAAIRSLVLKNN